MADLATLKIRREEAEAALHSLASGTLVVEVWRDGRRMKFNAASRGDLQTYLDGLNAQIDGLENPASLPRRRFIPVSY